ncbi:MAG: alpha/beta hydrolase [Defluviitaleaceae bacterium]|nr:alpha/beta hydrolase [Defluviitaleaceae bacterium]
MKKHMDILFKQTGGIDLYLDLYMPENKVKPPLIMWIHGGAWMYGDRKSPIMLWQVERGYALASISYRLTGQGVFPAHIIDCKDALVYLKKNADKYGYDPGKIIVAGDSAGGHLAALMGTSNGHKDWEPSGADCSVQAVVDYYGPTAIGKEWPGLREGDKGVDDPNAVQSPMLGAYVFSKQGMARAATASPLTYIDGSEPPFLILHGDADDIVPFKQSVYLRDALEAAGVPVSLHRVHGGGHGFAGADINSVIDAFLDKVCTQ